MNSDKLFLTNGERFIAASGDLQKTVQDLVRVAAQTVGSNLGALYLLDRSRAVLTPAVVMNLPKEFVDGCGDIPLGEQCCGRVALYKIPWYVEDIWSDPLFSAEAREGARRAGIRAGFSVPVLNPDNVCLGSLSAHFGEPHVPTEYEIQRHLLFAQLIGLALSRNGNGNDPSTTARRLGSNALEVPPEAAAPRESSS